ALSKKRCGIIRDAEIQSRDDTMRASLESDQRQQHNGTFSQRIRDLDDEEVGRSRRENVITNKACPSELLERRAGTVYFKTTPNGKDRIKAMVEVGNETALCGWDLKRRFGQSRNSTIAIV